MVVKTPSFKDIIREVVKLVEKHAPADYFQLIFFHTNLLPKLLTHTELNYGHRWIFEEKIISKTYTIPNKSAVIPCPSTELKPKVLPLKSNVILQAVAVFRFKIFTLRLADLRFHAAF